MATTRVIYTSDHGDNLGTRGLWGKSDMYEEAAGIPLLMAGPGVPRVWCARSRFRWSMAFRRSSTASDCRVIRRMRDLPGANLL